jgi:polyphosphate kinase
MLLEDVVRLHLPTICHGYDIVSSHTIRVTRETGGPARPSRGRRRGMAVRLQIDEQAPSQILALLRDELGLSDDEIYTGPGVVALSGLLELHSAVAGPRGTSPSAKPGTAMATRERILPAEYDAEMPALARHR